MSHSLEPPETLGDFRIDDLISDSGGMGDVFAAYQLSVKRKVAAKALKTAFLHDEEIRRRFEEEAIFLARLNHPGIVNVLAFDAERLVIFMEFLEGHPLDRYLRNEANLPQALPSEEALYIMDQVLAALGHAHNHGLVHRDVKPSNIFVAPNAQVKLTDFGIAKIIGQENLETTRLGLGSPSYMAPEQIMGDLLDGRTDIYSAGIVLYQMLTGQMPFSGKTYEEIIVRHIQNQVPSPSEIITDLPPLLCEIVLTATAKKPEDRFQSAEAFRRALSQVRQVPGLTAPATKPRISTPMLFSIGSMVVATSVVALLMLRTPQHGALQVLSNEPAELWIDGKRYGDTPGSLPNLSVGQHQVTILQPDFLEIQRKVEIRPEQATTVEVIFPAAGFLRVASSPPGKSVMISGKPRGTTPLSLKLPVGAHSVEIDGQSRTVTVLEGGEHLEAFP